MPLPPDDVGLDPGDLFDEEFEGFYAEVAAFEGTAPSTDGAESL